MSFTESNANLHRADGGNVPTGAFPRLSAPAKYSRSEAGRKGGLTAPGPGKRRGHLKGTKLHSEPMLLLPSVVDGRKVGRPAKLVADERTLDLIEFLGSIGCTLNDIAYALRVSKPTLLNFLTSHKAEMGGEGPGPYERGFVKFKIALRRKQLALAETNGAVAIFLGKNYLGQRDVVQVTREDGPIKAMSQQEITARMSELAAKLGYRLPDEAVAPLAAENSLDRR